MKKFIVLFLFALLSSLSLWAQTPSYVPTITPKAPDAAALMKFTDVPVSPYTGTASVSVPIYTVKAKGITIPVSIDYHTGGIRLEEEASSVGLGWALNAGGMISRTINDQDDLGGTYFGQPVPQPQGNLIGYQPANGPPPNSGIASLDSLTSSQCPTCAAYYNCPYCPINADRYIFDFNCSYVVNFTTGGVQDYSAPFSASASSPWDLEPDTYSFNFAGHSGKFIILRDEVTVVMDKQDNIKIQVVQNGPTAASIVFIITDENGNKFYFNDTQVCQPAWQTNQFPTSWYLSQIITQQNDIINFTYSGSGYTRVASENTMSYIGVGPNSGTTQTGTNIGTAYNNVNLSTIDYADGQVQFFYDNSRSDLDGGVKLDSVRVFSKTTAGLKYLKSDLFSYSYFVSATSGLTYVNEGSLELTRLRLDAVKEVSGGVALNPYSFVYNKPPFPYGEKHSYAIDHWGYYNAAPNTTLLPTTSAFYAGSNSSPPTQFTYSGANREPSSANSQVLSLHKITYPTGGSSIFNYEANTYDYNNSIQKQTESPQQVYITIDTTLSFSASNFTSSPTISGTIDLSNLVPLIPANVAGNPNLAIKITFRSNYTNGWPGSDKNGLGLYFEFDGNKSSLSGATCPPTGPVCSGELDFKLGPGQTTGTWSAHYDSGVIPIADFQDLRAEFIYKALKTVVAGSPTLTAGGIRIHSIIDSTAETGGTIAKERVWNYNHGSTGQYSYGKLMSFPSYVHLEMQPYALVQSPALILFSSSNTPATSSVQGNIVGYSSVTETTVDPSNSADNGKIVYNYVNVPDSVISYNSYRMPGIPNIGTSLNGSEISRITYQNTGSNYWKLSETDNFYHTAHHQVYYSAKYRVSQVHNNQSGGCNGVQGVVNQGIGEFFPSIISDRILQDSTRNIIYDPADTTKFLTSTTKNYYDDIKHYYVTRSKTVDSKGNTHVSKVTYPQDYIPSGATVTGNTILDGLIGRNMVAETIEKQDSLYYAGGGAGYVTSASETRFKQLSSGTMVNDKEYKLDIVNPVTNFVPMSISGNTYSQDSRYRQLISFDKYDNVNNLAQYTLTNELPVSIIWDYKKVSPIAQVKNADTSSIAFTSFEAEGTGGWTIGSTTRDATTAMTGTQSYNLSLGNVSKGGLTSTTTYVVSYWTKNTSPLTIAGTITGYPIKGATINGWTYYEHQVTGQPTITLSGTGNIDELRLYPQNAQMTSYTYAPGVGVTTISDARGGINYYEYDSLQRLLDIKDQNGNIVKSFTYHYAGQ